MTAVCVWKRMRGSGLSTISRSGWPALRSTWQIVPEIQSVSRSILPTARA